MKCSTVTIFAAGKTRNDVLHLVGILFAAIGRWSRITQLLSVMLQIKKNAIAKCVDVLECLRYFIKRMDHIGEIIALGIDTLLFGLCYRLYVKQRNAIEQVEVRV